MTIIEEFKEINNNHFKMIQEWDSGEADKADLDVDLLYEDYKAAIMRERLLLSREVNVTGPCDWNKLARRLREDYEEYRFGQMLFNTFGDEDPFYMSEEKVYEKLTQHLDGLRKGMLMGSVCWV